MTRCAILVVAHLWAAAVAAQVAFAGGGHVLGPKEKQQHFKDALALKQSKVASDFHHFQKQALHLIKQLRNASATDKRDAKAIQKALTAAKSANVRDKLGDLADYIKGDQLKKLDRLKHALHCSRDVTDDLKKVLAILTYTQSLAYYQDTRKELALVIAKVEQAIQQQSSVRAQTAQAPEGAIKTKKLHNQQKNSRYLVKLVRSLTNRNVPDCATAVVPELKKAIECQQAAENKLFDGDYNKAVANQDTALQHLQRVKKKLHEHDQLVLCLAQEQQLLSLNKHCQTILENQLDLYAGAVTVRESIERNNGKISNLHKVRSLMLSDRQKDVLADVVSALEMLQRQEVPFDFFMALKFAQQEMKWVAQRLEKAQLAGEESDTTLLSTLKITSAIQKVQGDIKNVRAKLDAKASGKLKAAQERSYSKLAETLQSLAESQDSQSQKLHDILKSLQGPLTLLRDLECGHVFPFLLD